MIHINVVNKRKHKSTPHDFYCGRPSVLGNPFSHKEGTLAEFVVENREQAIEKHRKYFHEQIDKNKNMQMEIEKMIRHLHEFRQINLVCFCAPASCHADTIKNYLELKFWADQYHNANK